MTRSTTRLRRSLPFALAAGLGAVTVAGTALPAAADPVDLVAWEGSTWKVGDTGEDLIATFAAPAFDDSSWKTYVVEPGRVLGYGDADVVQPPVGFGPSSSNKYPVTYFRTTFEVADAGAISDLVLRHLRDDGTVIYLNGVEVLRSNMAEGPVTNTQYSATTVDGADERLVHENTIPATALVTGTNVLAVQVHQRSASSSDVALKLSLSGEEEAIDVPATSALPMLAGAGALTAVGAAIVFRRRPRTA